MKRGPSQRRASRQRKTARRRASFTSTWVAALHRKSRSIRSRKRRPSIVGHSTSRRLRRVNSSASTLAVWLKSPTSSRSSDRVSAASPIMGWRRITSSPVTCRRRSSTIRRWERSSRSTSVHARTCRLMSPSRTRTVSRAGPDISAASLERFSSEPIRVTPARSA